MMLQGMRYLHSEPFFSVSEKRDRPDSRTRSPLLAPPTLNCSTRAPKAKRTKVLSNRIFGICKNLYLRVLLTIT